MMRKKILGVVPGILLIALLFVQSVYAASFPDVNEGDWFYNYVNYVSGHGIMTGYGDGSFGPGDELTRGQFVTTLYRMEAQPSVIGGNPFEDVPGNTFYTVPIIWANENGIATGYNESSFGPDDSITREQIATMIFRYANYKRFDTSNQSDDLSSFPDRGLVSGYALNPMKWMVTMGIISGDQGNIHPHGNTSRAQCATILTRFLQRYEGSQSGSGGDGTGTGAGTGNGTEDGTGTQVHVHNYNVEILRVNATCTEQGSVLYQCECSLLKVEKIPAMGHTFEWKTIKAATYVDVGSEHQVCKTCGTEGEKREIPVIAHEHVWEDEIVEEPTCGEEGILKKTCELCGTETEEKIDATGNHLRDQYVITNVDSDNPLKQKQEVKCGICGKVLFYQLVEIIPADD